MQEIIQQRVPGGCHTPEEQVIFALETVRSAAHLLEFSGIDELESALADMHKPLVLLAAAGVLAEITFTLQDPQGVCGATALLDPWDIEDFEAVDLSRLRLVANREACGRIEIVCLDSELAQSIVGGEDWLPVASDSLEYSVSQASQNVGDENERPEEETHEHNDHYQGWDEFADDDGRLYDQLPDPDRVSG
jgi:hypothetical protein